MLRNAGNVLVFDDAYAKFLNYCKTFLVGSRGSPIPNPLNKIRLKEYVRNQVKQDAKYVQIYLKLQE